MVEVSVVKQKLRDYIVNQIDILGESNPAIKLVKPLAKRAIINNIDSFDKFINTIAKDGKKYIGEKYDMQKAHEVCSKFKDKLEDEVEVADVYVAINAQYHDYCELFEKWFGKGNFDDMIFESAISFWFDDVDFGEDKLWKYFNELK